MYSLFGCLISPKSVGYSASFFVVSLELSSLNFFTFSTLCFTNGIDFKSFGFKSSSHKHHLFFPFKNSLALKSGFIYFSLSGSCFISSSFSSSVNKKLPPSFGILPKEIFGTSQIGFLLFSITISSPLTKYGVIFFTIFSYIVRAHV